MMKTLVRTLLTGMFLLSSLGLLCAQQDNSNASQVPADNTKMNQRDRNQNEPTADQQKENTNDRQLTAQIRRAIVKDKSLSTTAHNVKIISQNGAVTLKGPVKSEEEKQAIESKATEIAGSGKVNNELQVAPTK
jgi:hyperosmotically inducible protein